MTLARFFKQLNPLALDFSVCDNWHDFLYLFWQATSVFWIRKFQCILNDKIAILIHN